MAHLTAAVVKKPAKKGKAGQSAKDAVKAAAKQRRQDKPCVKPQFPPWDKQDRMGREVSCSDLLTCTLKGQL